MANRYWIAGTSQNWNDTDYWSTTSGGSGGASVPGSGDDVIMDGNGAGDCVIDADVNVKSLDADGYTGHFDNATNDRSMTFGTGVTKFRNGSCTVSMGDATWTISGNFNTVGLGTLNANASTVVLDGSSKILQSDGGNTFHSMTVSGTVSISSGSGDLNVDGALSVTGTLTSDADRIYIHNGGYLDIESGGTLTLTSSSNSTLLVMGGGELRTLDGTINGPGSIIIRPTADGNAVMHPATYPVGVSVSLGASGQEWIPSAGTYTFNDSFELNLGSGYVFEMSCDTNNPDFIFNGDVDFGAGGSPNVTYTKGTGTITLGGSADQSIDFDGHAVEDIDVDKSAGTASFTGSAWTCDSFLLTSGTVDFDA